METLAPTVLLYWLPTPPLSCRSTIQFIQPPQEGEESWELVFDRTVFHPVGGGQTSDQGTLKVNSSSAKVVDVSMDKALGVVRHRVTGDDIENWKVGDTVELEVEAQTRANQRALHSAGHLIDVAMSDGLGIKWSASKGSHVPDKCYVEYIYDAKLKEWNPETKAWIESNLGEKCNELASKKIPTIIEMDGEVVTPESSILPVSSMNRVVTVANGRCPCGGTHVQDTSEASGIVIKEVTKKKKAIRVVYDVPRIHV